jgi:hypothetical protein
MHLESILFTFTHDDAIWHVRFRPGDEGWRGNVTRNDDHIATISPRDRVPTRAFAHECMRVAIHSLTEAR